MYGNDFFTRKKKENKINTKNEWSARTI